MNPAATRVATRVALALGIIALLSMAAGTTQPVMAQEAEHQITVYGLAMGVEHEGNDTVGGIGGGVPDPTPTPEPTQAPEPEPTPTPEPSGTTFASHIEQWRPLASQVFPAAVVDQVLAIIDCESNGDPNATGLSGERGLMQVHPRWHQAKADELFGPGANLYDPLVNLTVAASISNNGSDWSAWSCKPWGY